MDDVQKQAALSAIRTLLAMAGGALVTHGYLNDGQATEIAGTVMTLIPIVWGVVNKYTSENKTVDREVVAVNAGIASAAGPNPPTVSPAAAAEVIEKFAPPTTEGIKP